VAGLVDLDCLRQIAPDQHGIGSGADVAVAGPVY
jgi:hypothetical protein